MRYANAFFLLLIAFFSVQTTLAQTPAETHRKILDAIENRDYQTAVNELETLKKTDKRIFELNNYDYLLGRVAERRGDAAAAMANYQTVVARGSALKLYALRHLAQLARSSGNLLLERTFLQELLTFAPDSLPADAARIRQARSYFESKNYEAAIQAFANLQTTIGAQMAAAATPPGASAPPPLEKNPRYRENLVFLGEAYLQIGKLAEARDAFTKLVANLPNPAQPDDFALAGAKGLDRLDAGENYGRVAPSIPDLEHLRRAQIYQFNRDFPDARLHYQAIVTDYPQSGSVPDALFQIGRGYVQETNFAEAINWFERVQEQFPEHPVAKDALSAAASAYARVSKPKEAITRYQKFIDKYPDAENLERAYLNIVDIERDLGEENDALKWTLKTQEAFKAKMPEALALFAQLRIRFTQNDWPNALLDADRLLSFSDLGGTRVPGGTNKAEVTFMKGFALENLMRYSEAIDVYLSIPDGRGEYYGWRATERLKLFAGNDKSEPLIRRKLAELTDNIEARPPEAQRKAAQDALRLNVLLENQTKLLDILRKAYAALPDYQKVPVFRLLDFGRAEPLREKREPAAGHQGLADELLFLGLYDEGTPELEAALKENPKIVPANSSPADLSYTLAVFYKRGEMANRATSFIEPLWKTIPADYQIELIPRDQVELLYPAPYRDALLEAAPGRGVDPRFVLSIMRQESRYRADVKSNAAARGLMQFISTTANQIARELKRDNFRQDELYNPPTAILFGSQYLSNLFKQFPNKPAAVAAAYNGGEENVRRWLVRAKSDADDRYVPEIVFSQSKDYAYKVMANYRVYGIFYDENLRAR
ncbi:MAG: transglycosylase SLT domain-containing protein [Acidobacteria bacterium]|nr:transglycosylase SLT domain-containing protein [Acidobacteriota bacterium]